MPPTDDSPFPSDESLMGRFRQRMDEAPFEQLVSRYLSRGQAVARQILRDPALAEDSVQEAFLRVIRSRDRYDPGKPFSVWFYAILRNVCLDVLRRLGRQGRALEELSRQATSAAPAAADPPEIQAMLAGLPEHEREAVTLRVVNDLSMAEVAAATGVTEEAAKKRVQRGLKHLRQRLNPAAEKREVEVYPSPS